MADVVLVHDSGGDWVAMYVDGVLKSEGHSLPESSVVWTLLDTYVSSLTQYETDFQEIGKGYENLDQYTDLTPW